MVEVLFDSERPEENRVKRSKKERERGQGVRGELLVFFFFSFLIK